MPNDLGGATTVTGDRFFKYLNISSLNAFIDWILLCTALLGPNRVAELTHGWATGQPCRYRVSAVLSLTIDRQLRPIAGLDLYPLPLATDELPESLPASDGSKTTYVGQTLLTADATVRPAIFRPGLTYTEDLDARLECGHDLLTIAQALSLLADSHVVLGPQWNEYGELAPLVTCSSPAMP